MLNLLRLPTRFPSSAAPDVSSRLIVHFLDNLPPTRTTKRPSCLLDPFACYATLQVGPCLLFAPQAVIETPNGYALMSDLPALKMRIMASRGPVQILPLGKKIILNWWPGADYDDNPSNAHLTSLAFGSSIRSEKTYAWAVSQCE